MIREYRQDKHSRALLILLLTVVTAVNTSQAAVVCIGSDGHVAIEPAAHNHCDDDEHVHDTDALPLYASVIPHVDEAPCRPCTDIPVSAGTSKDQVVPGASKIRVLDLIGQLSLPETPEPDPAFVAASGPPTSQTCYYLPLRSIVLQV